MHFASLTTKRMDTCKKPHQRLTLAREAAGFKSGREAAMRHHWAESTYTQHENGTRGMRQAVIESYAKAFGVDASWISFGTGKNPPDIPKDRALLDVRGFAEADVAPLANLPRDRQVIYKQITRAILPHDQHPNYLIAGRSRPDLAIAKNDLIVSQMATTVSDGDIAIFQIFDEIGEPTTEIRRVVNDLLVGPLDTAAPALRPTDHNVAITGRVAGIVRIP